MFPFIEKNKIFCTVSSKDIQVKILFHSCFMPQADGWRKGHLCKKYFNVIYVTNKIEFKRKTYKNIRSCL